MLLLFPFLSFKTKSINKYTKRAIKQILHSIRNNCFDEKITVSFIWNTSNRIIAKLKDINTNYYATFGCYYSF